MEFTLEEIDALINAVGWYESEHNQPKDVYSQITEKLNAQKLKVMQSLPAFGVCNCDQCRHLRGEL